jgi:hypothetical protein
MQTENKKAIAAAKAGMDEKTARKYMKAGTLPSALKKARTWRTRKDPFVEIWEEIREKLVPEKNISFYAFWASIFRFCPQKTNIVRSLSGKCSSRIY